MLIDVDSRRPLKFTRKIESPEGDEVTIEIKRMHSCHLKRRDFARVQLPQDQPSRQPLLRDLRAHEQRNIEMGRQIPHQSSRSGSHGNNRRDVARYPDAPVHKVGFKARYHEQEKEISNSRMIYGNKRHQTHSGRIMRSRDNKPRYGSRYGSGPYDRKGELTWREKSTTGLGVKIRSSVHVRSTSGVVRDVVSYEQASQSGDNLDRYQSQRSGDEEIRNKSLARSLTYSPQREDVLENEQIIGAFDGMEILDSKDAEAMECDA
ncbi:hypothetical protein DY000_02047400 [Brassica cretica]|uniref:Uncharacterized protein n=1 Tax=Brassica cretica TaxID=69181 RepID=A0ABQ7F3Z2_BRACR|nr:hypothetical protein DY000_02047400 [Brassica cretica]